MTPAIVYLKKQGISHTIHQYDHDPESGSFGTEASEKLGIAPERIFKTLVSQLDSGALVVAVLPVSSMLNLKSVASAFKAKKAAMADSKKAERSTGYIVGGISPIGQKKPLKTLIDSSAGNFKTIFVSAGKRGLEIELTPEALVTATNGQFFLVRK